MFNQTYKNDDDDADVDDKEDRNDGDLWPRW